MTSVRFHGIKRNKRKRRRQHSWMIEAAKVHETRLEDAHDTGLQGANEDPEALGPGAIRLQAAKEQALWLKEALKLKELEVETLTQRQAKRRLKRAEEALLEEGRLKRTEEAEALKQEAMQEEHRLKHAEGARLLKEAQEAMQEEHTLKHEARLVKEACIWDFDEEAQPSRPPKRRQSSSGDLQTAIVRQCAKEKAPRQKGALRQQTSEEEERRLKRTEEARRLKEQEVATPGIWDFCEAEPCDEPARRPSGRQTSFNDLQAASITAQSTFGTQKGPAEQSALNIAKLKFLEDTAESEDVALRQKAATEEATRIAKEQAVRLQPAKKNWNQAKESAPDKWECVHIVPIPAEPQLRYLYGTDDYASCVDENKTCLANKKYDTAAPCFLYGSNCSSDTKSLPAPPVSFIDDYATSELPTHHKLPHIGEIVATPWETESGRAWCVGIMQCECRQGMCNVTYGDGSILTHMATEIYDPKAIGIPFHRDMNDRLKQLETLCDLIENEEQKFDVLLAMQVRLLNNEAISHVVTKDVGDTFAELSPNMLQKALTSTTGVFCDLGCGNGLQVLVAAIIGSFDRCYGIERNEELVDSWKLWSCALLRTDEAKWGPIIARITVTHEDICTPSQGTKTFIADATVLLCWNARFTDTVNSAMFALASDAMRFPGATLVCFTPAPALLSTMLVSRTLPASMATKSTETYWSVHFSKGKFAGDWFHLFQRSSAETVREDHGIADDVHEFEDMDAACEEADAQQTTASGHGIAHAGRAMDEDVYTPGGEEMKQRQTTAQVHRVPHTERAVDEGVNAPCDHSIALAPTVPPTPPSEKHTTANALSEARKSTALALAEAELKTSPNGVVVGVGWTASKSWATGYEVDTPFEQWADPGVTAGVVPLGLGGSFFYRPSNSSDGRLCPQPVLPGGRQYAFGGVIRNAIPGPAGLQPQEGHLDLCHDGPITIITLDGGTMQADGYNDIKLAVADSRQALSLVSPFDGARPIALDFWDWDSNAWVTITADPGKKEFILFAPTIAWHRGNGMSQGPRLYTMYLPVDSVVSVDDLVNDGLCVLKVSDVGGQPVRQHHVAVAALDGNTDNAVATLKEATLDAPAAREAAAAAVTLGTSASFHAGAAAAAEAHPEDSLGGSHGSRTREATRSTLKMMLMGMQGCGGERTQTTDAIRCEHLQRMLSPSRHVELLTVNPHEDILGDSSIRHIAGGFGLRRGFLALLERMVGIGFYPEIAMLDYYWLQVLVTFAPIELICGVRQVITKATMA